MPRTKVPKKKSQPKKVDIDAEIQLFKNECLELCERQKKLRNALKLQIFKDMDVKCELIMYGIGYPEKTIGEHRVHNSTYLKAFYNNLSTNNFNQSAVNSSKPKKKKRSLSCAAADDDGYLTGGSLSSNASRGARVSRSKTKAPAPRTTRSSRSLSRSVVPTKNDYKTPAMKKPAAGGYGMITPKMKPNTPQIVLRRPKQGEVAISLGGSPLMVNSVTSDNTANVNIPLRDGRLLCIQPERGLRYSQLPNLDAETAQQLLTLSDNIQKICAYNRA